VDLGTGSVHFVKRAFPSATVHRRLVATGHSPLDSIPSRVCHCLLAVRCVSRTDFPELSCPSNGVPWASPMRDELSKLVSVPLSGFPNLSAVSWQAQASWPCFVPHPFLELLPSEYSPRRSRQPLSRPLTPSRLSTGVRSCTARGLVTAGFGGPGPEGRRSRSPTTMGPLSVHRSALPGRPGSRTVGPTRSAGFTRLEVLFLLRVRSRRLPVSLKRRPLLSWASSPLESSPSTPRVLGPARASPKERPGVTRGFDHDSPFCSTRTRTSVTQSLDSEESRAAMLR
jgi:hypothetical protein